MAKKKRAQFAIPERKAYPINTAGRAKNAIARVQQHGTPSEKRRVFAAVKRRYPGVAKRSNVVPTRSGPGRRVGERPKTRAGGASVPGTVRRRKTRGGVTVARRRSRRRTPPRGANGRFLSRGARRGGARRGVARRGRRLAR